MCNTHLTVQKCQNEKIDEENFDNNDDDDYDDDNFERILLWVQVEHATEMSTNCTTATAIVKYYTNCCKDMSKYRDSDMVVWLATLPMFL